MAFLGVTVWRDANEVALGQPLQEFPVTIAAASTTSSVAIVGSGRQRNRVRLAAQADCYVTWGESPTALQDGTDGRWMPRGMVEFHDIEADHYIAVIEDA